MRALPLELKIVKSLQRIREWHDYWRGQIYVSFSGGVDSSALLHLVRSIYPDVPAVFADTGLEYPEIRGFVRQHENVDVVRPNMSFREVIERYGYPVVSKEQARFIEEVRNSSSERLRDIRLNGALMPDGSRSRFGKLSGKWKYLLEAPFKISAKCCGIIKKKPFIKYERRTGRAVMTGESASDSLRRRTTYLKYGCNAFEMKRPKSTPLGFWTKDDVLRYLRDFGVPYCGVYGEIVEEDGKLRTALERATGCLFCMFGVHRDGANNKFTRMKKSHPKLWKYCVYSLWLKDVLEYIGVPYGSESDDMDARDEMNSALRLKPLSEFSRDVE
jgi:3'-phosphoadenosine 5'-phosphosulfate sulfotransferase (PAPS reductase)/FAD synthetase